MPVTAERRKTGTIFELVNPHTNEWTDFAGQDINVEVAYKTTGVDEWDPAFWEYRGQAAMCKTADGTKIVRVRVGDGSSGDRQIYKQEITDPTDTSQWTTWTLLYSGTHYCVAIEPTTLAAYNVYSGKSDGFYANNVKKFGLVNNQGTIIRIKMVNNSPTVGHCYFQVLDQDTDGERLLDWYYCADVITPGVRTAEIANYRWYRHSLGALLHDPTNPDPELTGGFMYVFHAMAGEGGQRDKVAGQKLVEMWWENTNLSDTSLRNAWDNADVLLGPSGQAGFKSYHDITPIWDNATLSFWLFFTQEFRDPFGSSISSLRRPLYWCHTFGLPEDWSQPVPVGYSVWGFAGVVTFGSYMYIAGNGRVLRRLAAETVIDLSDYVVEGEYELPRDNAKGVGTIQLANPGNAVGTILGLDGTTDTGLTELPVNLFLGTKGPVDTGYTWKTDSPWWIASLVKAESDGRKRIEARIEDFRHRMEIPFAETISLTGQLDWRDWQAGGNNQIANYYTNDTGSMLRVNNGDAFDLQISEGTTLFTGWRGENIYVYVDFVSPCTSGRIVYRYQDANNYLYAEFDGTYVKSGGVVAGQALPIARVAKGATSGFALEIEVTWQYTKIYYNFGLALTVSDDSLLTGFVGVAKVNYADFKIRNFSVIEWNRKLTTGALLTKLLHWIGWDRVYTNPELEDINQINVLWGPQSDNDTPAKAFNQLVEASKLDVAWRNGDLDPNPNDLGVDYVVIDHFGTEDPDYSIEDEILSPAQVNDGQLRPNVVSVDGQTDSWVQYDRADLNVRQWPINGYFDLPELRTPGEVRGRAILEQLNATRASSPGGDVVWRPQYNRLDTIVWTDRDGIPTTCRIEGLKVSWSQGSEPFQHAEIDAGVFVYCPPTASVVTFLARDLFQRTATNSWGDAMIGGTWTAE